MLLRLTNISKAYGDNQVLDSVALTVDDAQKVGLVGANGVGKSTLLRIILGHEEPDAGAVWIQSGIEVGYLPQSLNALKGQTIDQYVDAELGSLREMEVRMRRLEAEMAHAGDGLDAILAEYARLTERYERRGGYDLAHRRDAVFSGLDIARLSPARTVDSLSGGEKMRVGLAALLLRSPDLFILDEPTNHLDFAALEWLEQYLRQVRSGMLVVSHDRHFLNETVTTIVEIVEGTREAKSYSGSYDFYAAAKEEERRQWEESYQRQQDEIWALRKFIKSKARQVAHNRPPKDGVKDMAYNAKGERVQDAISRNVHSAEEKLRRLEADPIPRPPRPLRINPDFDPEALVSRSPLTAGGLRKAYGSNVVLADVGFSLAAGSRVVIVGPNGAGKSTLLRLLVGREEADAGEIAMARSAVAGYLDQEQETLDTKHTLFEVYREQVYEDGRTGDWETLKAELLRYGLFTYADLQKSVAQLSIGQKRKLQIACLIAQRANLLLLDEPTNHVSLDVLEEFERALLAFPGPIIAVSHDRHFIRRFANEVWQLKQGEMRRYLGEWDEVQGKMRDADIDKIPAQDYDLQHRL